MSNLFGAPASRVVAHVVQVHPNAKAVMKPALLVKSYATAVPQAERKAGKYNLALSLGGILPPFHPSITSI